MKRLIVFPMIALTALPAMGESVQFNRDIRPILTKECTACHGGVKAAGGISFIFRDMALGEADSGNRAIVPGKPDQSEVMKRIRSKDPDEVMPKPKHGPPLDEHEIALIEKWIAEGAEWQEHWAFVDPKEVAVEKVSDESWPNSKIDRFVLQSLDSEGLKPAVEAPPEEWLRRASYDLTGLPPTFEELKAFKAALKADGEKAYEAAADRLLASNDYGERWAAVWLDLARYSDTFGFEKDPHRNIWPYRDWVIRAFNKDMPYDQFTIEQLAGDLLPNPTADQRLATAFHRNTQNNTEGGTNDEEFRVAAVMDRVATTWTAWQATTFGCVQCHAHPYDPIEHDEYYQFTAFFNNSEDHDLDSDVPHMKVANDPKQIEEVSKMEVQMREWREQLNAVGLKLEQQDGQWKQLVFDQFEPTDGEFYVDESGALRNDGALSRRSVHKLSAAAVDFTAMRIEILPDSDDPTQWPVRGSLVTKFESRLIDAEGKAKPVVMKEVFVDHIGGVIEATPTGGFGGYPKLHQPRWVVLVPEKRVEAAPGSRIEVEMRQARSTTGSQHTAVRRFRIDVSRDEAWTSLVNDSKRAALWDQRSKVEEKHKSIKGVQVPVMVEGATREQRVFARGNRMNKAHVVQPGIPKIFGGQAGEDLSRLDMAKWIASEENPLTARVMVNRLWSELFGIGLVETVEDFGTSGTAPSHLELLDHMALKFQGEHEWSVKHMLRDIVLSATYRQTHRATKEAVTKDPKNRLLARGPRNRLTAEMVRDQALAVAGLLSDKMYGPSVFPRQPDGLWKSTYSNRKWNESKGEDRLRRGIYTYHKRTAGFPGFLMFDAPSRELCSARRIVSNTPLQALVTMNDPAHIEAAQGFAKRIKAYSDDVTEQHRYGMMLATQLEPDAEVLAHLASLREDAVAGYRESMDDAKKLGETPEEAALVLLANTILNLDAALTK